MVTQEPLRSYIDIFWEKKIDEWLLLTLTNALKRSINWDYFTPVHLFMSYLQKYWGQE